MIYGILRWIAGIALHWFYSDIRVVGKEKIPRDVPLLIAVNHPNALVDSLVVGWLMPRRVVMTAKATLIKNPFIAVLFRMLGVVPLRRARDEATDLEGQRPSPARNSGAFREMLDVLSGNGAVLIFPEGTSHSNKELAPLKTGLARVALRARDSSNIRSVQIVPIGLLFENKATPGTVVGVRVGDLIDVDSWQGDLELLTAELTNRLRAVTEQAVMPPNRAIPHRIGPVTRAAIGIAAAWGRFTHRLPIEVARRLATRMSTDADQPAMFTIIIGVGLVLATYAINVAVIGALAHSFWIASLYLLALVVGAHWAAFEPHVKR
ncbi:MAG TPA: 1-acyl-sn-glycerol-3-phosphate acyltransferase [Gemmatimonadaceae bacterium]|nr:1-acyl-sn-glycerol-3-phosphate acyltransferase [Gemmatimonadaceae bacterium]